MKKMILLVMVVAIFTACQQTEPQRWFRNSTETEVTKALLKDYQTGNWSSWLSHYSDTAKVFHNTTQGVSPQKQQEALKQTIQNLNAYQFNENKTYIEMVLDDNNETWVYFWSTWEATVAGSNTELIVPVHLALQFVDNKVVREYGFYDASSIMMALTEKEAVEMAE